MKKIISLILVATMILSLAACSAGEKKEGNNDKMKVALAVTGPVNDGGWCQIAYDGLMKAKKELGVEVSYTENVKEADMEATLTDYAAQGYDLVIGHGFQFGDPALAAGKKYPNVKFVCIEAAVSSDNVASYIMKCEQSGYLLGMLSAGMSKSGKIGMISALQGPSLVKIVEAYKLGAKEINPKIQVADAYTGSFEDIAKAKEAAIAMINGGADVVSHCANQAGMGVIKAAEENGVLATGDSFDQNSISPDVVFASSIYNVPQLVYTAISDVKNGKFKGEIVELGIKDGIVDLSSYNGFENKIPADLKEKVAKRYEEIKDGTFEVPYIPEPTK